MPWQTRMTVGQETFTTDGDRKFALSHGTWKRRLNLNTIGSWETMWIVFLVSAEVPYAGWSAYGSGTWSEEPCITLGLGSSIAGVPRGYVNGLGGSQWLGGFSGEITSGGTQINTSGGKEYFLSPCWSAWNKNGTTSKTTGQTCYTCLGADKRAAHYVIIQKGSPTNWSVSYGYPTAATYVDVSKQDAIDWLLGYSTSIAFASARPTGHRYSPPGTTGVDMEPGIYGELDTIFATVAKGSLKWKLHAVYGRIFSSVV